MNNLFYSRETGDVFNLEIGKTPDKSDFKIRKGLNNLPFATLIGKRTNNFNPNIFKTFNYLYVKISKRINNFHFSPQFHTIAGTVICNGRFRLGVSCQGNKHQEQNNNFSHNIKLGII